MYLSQYNISLHDAIQLRLTNTLAVRRVVYSLFPAEKDRKNLLFADKGLVKRERVVLILSAVQPEMPEIGNLLCKKIPDSWFDAEDYNFVTVVNPSCTDSSEIDPSASRPAVLEWFAKAAPEWGFELKFGQIDELSVDRTTGEGKMIDVGKATISGTLHVTDRERFILCFSRGLGGLRNYGCGLLQIVPVE